MINIIYNSKNNKTPYLFKNILSSVPKWEHFINHLNLQYQNTETGYHALNTTREKFINGVLFKDPFYINITDPTIDLYPQIELFFAKFGFLGEGKALSAYVNFAKEPPSHSHVDAKDHFYWQCIGSTIWQFKDVQYQVDPGDVVYIPSYVEHNVITTEPRAAIQFEYKLHLSKLKEML